MNHKPLGDVVLPWLLLLVIVPGCSETPVAPATDASVAPLGTPFSDMLAAWEADKKNEAAAQFVELDWNATETLSQVPLLNLAESEFQALSQNERNETQQAAMNLIATLRGLARQVIANAEEAEAAGDSESAEKQYEAVREFGAALVSPQRLQIFQMVGKAYTQVGADGPAAR
jgi:hypothetical protein